MSDWDKGEGEALDENGEKIESRIIYSRKVNVSINVLEKYIHKENFMRGINNDKCDSL